MSVLLMLATFVSMLVMMTQRMLVLGFVDNSPGCFDSCSTQVNCTISPYSGFCGAGLPTKETSGPDIAAEPVDLRVDRSQDGEHQFVNLSWRPPEDGSYNYLKSFLVQVIVINLDPAHNGVSGPSCYIVQPASNWFETHRSLHRQGGVVFFMNCLRIAAQASVEVVISIHSLPLKPEAPKLALTKVYIYPDNTLLTWNPKFKKWADDDDVMHLIIQNPLKEARYYEVQIKSVERDRLVFSHIFPAWPDNKTHDQLIVSDENGLPHFLVPGLRKEDNYSILMDVLDGNKTGLPHMRSIQTTPFSLNFSSLPLVTSATISRGLDNSLFIIISISVVVVVAILVCLVWKGVIRPSRLLNLARNCSLKMNNANQRLSPSFTAVYCYENESYVGAVESHVSLVQRYLGQQSAQDIPQRGLSFCGPQLCEQGSMENNELNMVIYLSPRLGEVLKFRQTGPVQCSSLDVRCHQLLRSLQQRRLKGQGPVPLVVTFDCFHQAELAALHDLTALVFPPEKGEGRDLPTPLKMASLGPDGWKIENLDPLIGGLNRRHARIQDSQKSLQGWKDSEEAKAVERCLSLLGSRQAGDTNDVTMFWKSSGVSDSQEIDSIHFSNTLKRSYGELAASCIDSFNKTDNSQNLGESNEELKSLPNAPLISNSTGYESGSCSRALESFHQGVFVPKSSMLNHHNVHLPLSTAGDIGHFSHKASYSYDPTKRISQLDSVESSDMVQINKGRTNGYLQDMVTYKPNVFSKHNEAMRSSPVNSVESDSLLSSNDLNGHVRRRDRFLNDVSYDTEWDGQKERYRVPRLKEVIIPPSLCHSNFTSLDSVCERINRVNEYSGWSESNLSK